LVRTAGPGSVRRKRKGVHHNTGADDQKLQASIKKLGVSSIGDIEDVNLIMDDGTVIHFSHPKVQASIQSNTYVVSGHSEIKQMEEMLPSIINQLGVENVDQLKAIAQRLGSPDVAAAAATSSGKDEIPETESFE